jgi:putative heme-binding domain-containing protein
MAAPVIEAALASNAPVQVQTAAIQTLSSFDEAQAAPALLKHWKSLAPEARVKAVGALLAKKERVPMLLAALEGGALEPAAVDIGSRSRLLESHEPGVADRARKIFGSAGGDRAKVVAQYKDVLDLKGDEKRGELAFGEHCARCHMPRKQGGRVGPDLSGINNKTREELLEAILNPSSAIESRFVYYVVTAKDGRMYDSLRGGAEEDVTLLRPMIADIRASSISLMPEDLEKAMTRQSLADIMAYLRGGI